MLVQYTPKCNFIYSLKKSTFEIFVKSTTNFKISNGVLCNEVDGLHQYIAFFYVVVCLYSTHQNAILFTP